MSDERLKIAVFVDFDNIEIGVKTTLGTYFDVGAVLEAIKERGEVVTKVAYGDWTRATDYGRSMSQHAVHMVQRNLTPGGDKNGADINLALDALEMAFTHSHINAFVIVGGDSDFITLVEKLKQYDRKVFVVGGRAFTSQVMQKNCTEFVAYEDIIGVPTRGRHAERGGRSGGDGNLAGAMPLVKRALKLLADREVVPQLGLLKSTLLQLDSSFSERAYGASSFRDFVQKLAKAGHVVLKGTERSFHVELREGADQPASAGAAEKPEKAERGDRHERSSRERGAERPERPEPAEAERADAVPVAQAAPAVDGEAALLAEGEVRAAEPGPAPDEPPRLGPVEGFRVIQAAFSRPGMVPRFPMYIRQVKQFVRQYDETFDERRYGFSGLVDALRYGQREGFFRLDRDRQGVVRVFPGAKLQRPGTDPAAVVAGGSLPPFEPGDVAGEPPTETASTAPPVVDTPPAFPEAAPAAAPEADAASAAAEPDGAAIDDVATHVEVEAGVVETAPREDAGAATEKPEDTGAAPASEVTQASTPSRQRRSRPRTARAASPKAGTKPAQATRKRTAATAAPRRGARKRTKPEQE